MQEFIKEWGPVIIAAAAILILVAIVQNGAVRDAVQQGFTNILNKFTELGTGIGGAGGSAASSLT